MTGTGASASAQGADGFARDWRELRADGDIQFAPLRQPEPEEPPQWWRDFVDWLREAMAPVSDALSAIGKALGLSGQALTWILVALGAVLIVLLAWRVLVPLRLKREAAPAAVPDWTPDAGEALALLEDADRLAAAGRYDEATHLLLKRSVGQIAAARPGLLEPSSTAREIAALPALPEAARGAFGVIAERVERSLFALRRLSADDWQAAREAYARFALAAPQAA